jgi:3D (Asp-Asp-Asp) domain-containing protein
MKKVKTLLLSTVLGLSIAGMSSHAFAAAPMNLQTGQESWTYSIKKGDTLWKLSRKFHVPLANLLSVNPDVRPRNLQIGEKIRIPSRTSKKNSSTNSRVESTSRQTLPHKKELSMVATAYTAAPGENGGYAGIDYMGNPLHVGTVAVDPSVIPLGSTLYITGYDFPGLPKGGMIAHATDIGVHGNRIDIFVPTSPQQATKFGMQNIKVYVLK